MVIKNLKLGTYWWQNGCFFKLLGTNYQGGTGLWLVEFKCLWADNGKHSIDDRVIAVDMLNWTQTNIKLDYEGFIAQTAKNTKEYTLWLMADKIYKVALGDIWEGTNSSCYDKPVKVERFVRDASNAWSGFECSGMDYTWKYFLTNYKLCEAELKDVGTSCISCNRDYPYADAAVNFKCWGCANGY